MNLNGYYKVEISNERFQLSYSFHCEQNFIKIIRNLQGKYQIIECLSNPSKNIDGSRTYLNENRLQQIIKKLETWYFKFDSLYAFNLHQLMSKNLKVSFIDFDNFNDYSLGFILDQNIEIYLDNIFLTQFQSNGMKSATWKFISIISKLIEERSNREIKVMTRDSILFEEYFLIDQVKSKYFGFLDNDKANTLQYIFEIDTNILLNIFKVYYKMIFESGDDIINY